MRIPSNCIQVASLAQLLPPPSPTVRNPAPDSSLCRLQSCSPIASASAAAPGPDCGIRFNCCSPFASASSCCSPIAPASSAACRLHPLQLLLPIASTSAATPRLRRPLQLLLPDYVRFDCCSPIALAALNSKPMPGPKLESSRTFFADPSSRFSK